MVYTEGEGSRYFGAARGWLSATLILQESQIIIIDALLLAFSSSPPFAIRDALSLSSHFSMLSTLASLVPSVSTSYLRKLSSLASLITYPLHRHASACFPP